MTWKRESNPIMEALGAKPEQCPTWRRKDGLLAIKTESVEQDGTKWVHVSVSRKDRLPSWYDLKDVKNFLIGSDKKVIQVIPPESEHVNIHSHCLHLWHCCDADPLPDFTWGTGSI